MIAAEYRFRFDEKLLIESLRRYRQQEAPRPGRGFFARGFTLVVWAGVVAFLLHEHAFGWAAVIGLLLLSFAAVPAFERWRIKKFVRASPSYNDDVVVQVSEQGYLGVNANSRTELSWRLFTKGRRFDDGFLLISGVQVFHWWPDVALCGGSVQALEALIKSKLSDYAVV